MAVVDVRNTNGDKVSDLEVSDAVFNVEVKTSVLHDIVKMQLAKRRAGTASVKSRGEVKGSTRKLFRQKGTGNARPGSIKSPLRNGGGVIFGPQQRSYAYKLPKKVMRLGLRMALSGKLKASELIVLDAFQLDAVKTREFVKIAAGLNLENALIVVDGQDKTLELSARNVPNVKVIRVEGLNVYDILKHKNLVMLAPAVKTVEGRLS
ncbi:MAG: 50S ribosomal protein L4 [Deltaproteobacteria bacterium]|nr:MAG: 50S ribosomal protein L4 [Deltaproteobacteria bacterium]